MKVVKIMKLINKIEDFSGWYNQIVEMAKLCEHSSVKGCITILPYGYALWESIQTVLNGQIKSIGAVNMAFPLLIPYSFFDREKDHVDGFIPEVALVTSAGGKQLDEPLVVRPTSEVIIHEYFKHHIHSWRDLPLKVNQWCSVLRWEKRPRPFIRTTEFWWQEGHTAHVDFFEAQDQAKKAILLYHDFCRDFLAVPTIIGIKPSFERFAGASETFTIEGIMPDGKAIQMGTSHILGAGFAQAVGMKFQNADMQMVEPVLTSWGVTTRLIGALVMVHGDEKGLVIPPFIASILIYIVPIWKNSDEKGIVQSCVDTLLVYLNRYHISYYVDWRDFVSPGVKFCEAELQGFPIRLDIGVRDVLAKQFSFVVRDINERINCNANFFMDLSVLDGSAFIQTIKKDMHVRMFQKAFLYRKNNIVLLSDLGTLESQKSSSHPFCVARWCERDYEKIKALQYTVRCIFSEEYCFKTDFSFSIDDINLLDCCVHGQDCCQKKKVVVLLAKCY